MYDPANVAERINKLLKEKNLQQKDMLMECGLNKNTISSMLSRGSMVKADTLAKIADFLSCSLSFGSYRKSGNLPLRKSVSKRK